MIRSRLLPTLCAVALLGFTGCTGDDKSASGDTTAASPQPAPAVASPKPAADELIKNLTELGVRIRTADAAFARVVGVTATDPEDRLIAFNKAVRDIGGDTATSLAADLKKSGVDIVAAWDSSTAAIADAGLRRIADGNRDVAALRFAELDKAIKGTDAALAYHAALINQVGSVIGSRPGSDQLVAARPVSAKLTAAGNKVAGWLDYTTKLARKAGLAPVPVIQPKVEDAKPAEAAPAEVNSAEVKTPETTVPEVKAPEGKAPEVKPPAAPVAKPDATEIIIEVKHAGEPATAPVEPQKGPATKPEEPVTTPAKPDPVPEPVEA